jgi:hypothetical protein
MTTLMPPPQTRAYALVNDLCESATLTNIHRSAADEWAREDLLLAKLGARGWGRVHHFRNYYASGWGEHAGRVLSPRGLGAFFQFMEAFTFPGGVVPSVFLTDRGGIELCWEDENGKSVQVEFTRTDAEFYREATSEEGVVAHGALKELLQRLAS